MVYNIPVSQLSQTVVNGDCISITIPEDGYQAGIDSCKYNLHGRVICPKGPPLLKVNALRDKLLNLQKVRSSGSWNLNHGFLKHFAWTCDFDRNIQHQTSAQDVEISHVVDIPLYQPIGEGLDNDDSIYDLDFMDVTQPFDGELVAPS
ncbi:hypothetical protein KIW84_071569 [Lathyrus oleraceus]|uniref:Uncharacterized protein n=1 Tax=Pisum sativum TaxID=3888 RepID=A0A9D4VIL8_PEA|nr:hypothetical protein KIW84_071569 [Pisum sativum]